MLDNIVDYIEIMVKFFPYEWGTSTKAYISEETAEKLQAVGLKEMQVSLDSFNPEHANQLMGDSHAFDEVIATMNNLKKAGIEVTLKAVITSLNIYDIPDYFRKGVELGIKHIRVSYYYASANRHSDALKPTNQQLEWLNNTMPDVLEFLKGHGVTTDYYKHPLYSPVHGDERIFCGGYTKSMSVRYDGQTLFCDSLNHTDEFVSGNLKDKSIMEIWNSEEAQNMGCPEYFKEKFIGTKCYNCKLYHNCFYKRCYVRSYNTYGKYFEVDPACPYGEKDYIL